MEELFFQDITVTGEQLRAHKLSIPELTKAVLARIRRLNPSLCAFITVMEEQALAEAEQLQKELDRGEVRGPLHGIPVSVKDILWTQGVRTTAGSKVLEHWVPDEDGTVIVRLREAGAVLIGKNNLHEFAMGATTENATFGDAKNPWRPDSVPGGSSGGSGVAVASGMGFASIGTDTAGSIRLPAALCGIVGLKPTYGRVSRYGCLPFSWSLDHIGPLTRTVRDAALVLKAVSGYDPRDPTSSQLPFNLSSVVRKDLHRLTIGICRDYFFEGMDDEIAKLMRKAEQQWRELGVEFREISFDGIPDALEAQKVIAQAEGYAFHREIFEAKPELYGEDVRFRLNFGKNVSAHAYLDAQRIRKRFLQQVLSAMQPCDVLLTPGNVNPPFAIGTVSVEDSINNMFYLARTPLINLLGFPALMLPCGFTGDGLPVGMQLVGKPFQEAQLLGIGEVYEAAHPWLPALQQNQAYL